MERQQFRRVDKMPINTGSMGTVQYFGTTKPGPGVNPLKTGIITHEPKRPFGVAPGIDWMSGEHIKLGDTEDGSEPPPSLASLSDTDLTQDAALVDSDMLVYDSATKKWKGASNPFQVPEDQEDGEDGGDGEDGSATAPSDGDVLVYDSTTKTWVYQPIPAAATQTLVDGDYNPVEIDYTAATGVLRYRVRQFVILAGILRLGDFGAWTTINTAEGCP